MFKSVFSRIMTTFSVILLICILLLVIVVLSGLFQESQDKQLSELTVAAMEVGYYLKNIQGNSYLPTEVLLQSRDFLSNLKEISGYIDADITVARADGSVAVSSSPAIAQKKYFLTADTVNDIAENVGGDSNRYTISTLDGALEQRSLNSFVTIRNPNDELLYLIIVTGKLVVNTGFTSAMTKRMAVVSIWIFFAAIICVSLISRKITNPIKEIGDAAKAYAQGQFNARVEVRGKDEIAELGQAFNNMAGSLATHEENRNTFLSNVSHDLRTPMTTISGFVDGMLDGTIPPDQQEHYLQIISGEVHRLSRLVNTLLEVSRLESGRNMKMSDFNLSEKARQVLISLVNKIESKKIDIDFRNDEDIYVTADPDAIHQVLYNLIDNAVKFTDEGGTIEICISPEKGKKAGIWIRNTGKGIPEEEIQHVFERFYKSDRSRGLDKNGTGLGLYIVKTILDKHGEEIHVDSVPGEYTEFRFTLPVSNGRKPKENTIESAGPTVDSLEEHNENDNSGADSSDNNGQTTGKDRYMV